MLCNVVHVHQMNPGVSEAEELEAGGPPPPPPPAGAPPSPPLLGAGSIGAVAMALPHGMKPKPSYTVNTPVKHLNWNKVSKTTQHRSFDSRLTYLMISK